MRYNDVAEQVFFHAKAAARDLKHTEVAAAHILIGLVIFKNNVQSILTNRGVNLAKILEIVPKYSFTKSDNLPDDLPWDNFAQFVSTEAANEAKTFGQEWVGPEHILLAMTRLLDQQWLKIVSEKDLPQIRQEVFVVLNITLPWENFPFDTFRFLEALLRTLRKAAMDKAAGLARGECSPTSETYVVGREHAKRALKDILSDSTAVLKIVGCE